MNQIPDEGRLRLRAFVNDDQINDLLKIFKPEPAQRSNITESDILGHLASILSDYDRDRLLRGDLPDLETHRKKLHSVLASAKKLTWLIKQEPLILRLLASSGSGWLAYEYGGSARAVRVHAAPDSEARVAALHEALELIESNASWMLSSPDILRRFRFTPEEATHLSLERRKIWEPVILLYYDCKKRVGISRKGPVQKILSILHEDLGLKPPKAESVLRAIQDFRRFVEEHGRPAASPADSIYSAAIVAGRISYHPGENRGLHQDSHSRRRARR